MKAENPFSGTKNLTATGLELTRYFNISSLKDTMHSEYKHSIEKMSSLLEKKLSNLSKDTKPSFHKVESNHTIIPENRLITLPPISHNEITNSPTQSASKKIRECSNSNIPVSSAKYSLKSLTDPALTDSNLTQTRETSDDSEDMRLISSRNNSLGRSLACSERSVFEF